MKKITIKGWLAIAAYVGAAGISITHWSDGFWFVAVVCLLMAAIRHPSAGHLLCSAFLVLWTLIYTGEIGWMANYVPIIIITPCIILSTKMLAGLDARTWMQEPEPEVICPLERKRRHNEEIQRILLCGSFDDD